MKQITLISLFLSLSSIGFSQINKGQFLVGGIISLESFKYDNSLYGVNESNTLNVAPNIGYFLCDKLAAGLRLNFVSINSNNPIVETLSKRTSINPFLRYYFLPKANKVNAFFDAGYIYQRTRFKVNSNEGPPTKADGYSVSAGPAIFLNKKIALEFIIRFTHTKANDIGNTKENTFSSGLGLQIHL